jgi:hypothetical protein
VQKTLKFVEIVVWLMMHLRPQKISLRDTATSYDTFWNLLEQGFSSSSSAYNILSMDRSVNPTKKTMKKKKEEETKNSHKL